VRDIRTLKKQITGDTDTTIVQRNIYYKSFRNGIYWAVAASFVVLLLLILNRVFSWGLSIEIRDIASVFTCGMVVATCFYHAKNLRLNIEANQKKLDFDYEKFEFEQELKQEDARNKSEMEKKIFAFTIAKELGSPTIGIHMHTFRLFHLTNPLMGELKTIAPADTGRLKEWADKFDVLPERSSIIMVLNYFENVAISIKKGFADEDVCKEILKTVVCQVYQGYKTYIDYRQSDAHNGSATFMENFEQLAIKWSNGTLKK
jgi:hypothetical protein